MQRRQFLGDHIREVNRDQLLAVWTGAHAKLIHSPIGQREGDLMTYCLVNTVRRKKDAKVDCLLPAVAERFVRG